MREKTYYAKLCLLQLNNGTVSAIVDPLAVTDLSPLVPVLTDENCVKIFHAGTQDIAILHHETGVTPSPVFDTQVAASLLGYPLQVGYGPLVRSVCDVKLAKADSYTDWSKRPLTNSQIKYALDDVVYLRASTNACATSSSGKDASHGASVTSARLPTPQSYDVDPRETWRRVKRISSLSRGSSQSRAKSPHGASSRRNTATFRASGCLPTRRSSKSRARRPSHVRRSSRCVGSPTSSTDVTSTRSSMR